MQVKFFIFIQYYLSFLFPFLFWIFELGQRGRLNLLMENVSSVLPGGTCEVCRTKLSGIKHFVLRPTEWKIITKTPNLVTLFILL